MDTKHFARLLRRSATREERLLWRILQGRGLEGYRFRRQRPIGPYVADFVCLERRVIVEIDGWQHGAERSAHDERRARFLTDEGYRIVRFWNAEVRTNPEGVADAIGATLRLWPLPRPPKPRP